MVPVQLRVGGAFLGLAAAMLLYAIIGFLGSEATFAITPQVLTVFAAIGLLGAFATTSTQQNGSRTQVIALAVAVGLIGLGILLPDVTLMVTTPVWLAAWAVAAALCAVVLRRSVL